MPFAHLDDSAPLVLPDDEGLLEFILDYGPNLVFIKDEESRIVYANKAFLALYPPDRRDTIIGTTTVENFPPEEADLFLSEDRRALREGRTELVEDITDWKAQTHTLLTRKMVFQTPGGERRLVCISTNIDTLARRERRIVRLNAQLKVYAHTIAHDLKNPLASIVSGLRLLDRDGESSFGRRARSIIDALRESATGLASSVTAMLKAAAEETAKDDFKPSDLNILLEEVRFNLSAAIEGANLKMNVARLPTAKVEPNLIRQLFQNLIENTIKHSGVERPVITLHYKSEDDEHVFYFGDNGQGIPPEKRDLVFSQFFRDGSNDGLGLGLTICQRIVHLHDGYIEVHDRDEPGCCFVIRLPRT